MYNWEFKNWPEFSYDKEQIISLSQTIAVKIGELKGAAKGLSTDEILTNMINQMIAEAIKTSEIEGQFFSREDVMSSIKNNLGINKKAQKLRNPKADGVGKLMVEIQNGFSKKLSESQIKKWHSILFVDSKNVKPGKWRSGKESMQIVSGVYGREKVHFVAPPSAAVPSEMKDFVKWYNDFKVTEIDIENILIKTAISHLYFESIHPFEDGNGRIGRAVSEKCLFQSLGNYLPISISTVIESEKKKYYQNLKNSQNTLEITPWIIYFSKVILKSLEDAQSGIVFTLNKTKFSDKNKDLLNARQAKVIRKIFEAGAKGFEGGMTARKYISIAKTSKATATRDLQDLVEKGIFIASGMGRNVSYTLEFENL